MKYNICTMSYTCVHTYTGSCKTSIQSGGSTVYTYIRRTYIYNMWMHVSVYVACLIYVCTIEWQSHQRGCWLAHWLLWISCRWAQRSTEASFQTAGLHHQCHVGTPPPHQCNGTCSPNRKGTESAYNPNHIGSHALSNTSNTVTQQVPMAIYTEGECMQP